MRHTLSLLVLFLAWTHSATAQGVTVTPFFGTMTPAAPFQIGGDTHEGLGSGTHTVFGIRATRPLSSRFAIEVGAGMGHGTVQWWEPIDSRVLFADLRGRLLVAGRDADGATALNLLAGAGWIRYDNSELQWESENEQLNIHGSATGIVGAQFRLRRARLGIFELEVTDRIHRPGITSGSITIDEEDRLLQHDLAFTLGYVLQL